MGQLCVNACDIASFTNRFQEMISDASSMGLLTLTLVTDDLYQCYLETHGLPRVYIHRAATILLRPLVADDRIVWYVNDYNGQNTCGLGVYFAYLLGALDERNIALAYHAPIVSTASKSASKLPVTKITGTSGTMESTAVKDQSKVEEKSKSKSVESASTSKSEEKPEDKSKNEDRTLITPVLQAADAPAPVENRWADEIPPGGVWADQNIGKYFEK